MQKFLSLALLLIFITSCEETIQGNGEVKRETRESAPFESIDVSGGYEVFIKPANYSSLTIEADENLLEHIETYVKSGVLHISSKKNFSRYQKLAIYITAKDLKRIEASGASEISSQGTLQGKDMKLDFSGAVEARLEINAERLEGDFSGACEVKLRGNANRADFETSGAVEIDAEKFRTKTCRLDMSGAGQAVVFATEELNVKVSGAAQVRYKGNPGSVKQDISGAASIKPL